MKKQNATIQEEEKQDEGRIEVNPAATPSTPLAQNEEPSLQKKVKKDLQQQQTQQQQTQQSDEGPELSYEQKNEKKGNT